MATKAKKKLPAKRSRPATAVPEISPCLWFDSEGHEAAKFYVSIFKKSRIKQVTRYPGIGQDIHGKAEGSVMTVEFVLNGMSFTALNGGPAFKFNEAISLMVLCNTQKEIDYYWEKLGAGGDPRARQCGWLKDKYGVSWQIAPAGFERLYKDFRSEKTRRAFAAMMQMKKLDIAALEAAYKGKG
ncbi:VOC family protein [Usitatibacter palustris]|uniref:PhnB-like domain-containing protein n=1 Tax=Usitatibacter palustris TaxID=2732487 RepID=A0A6M4H5G9_9PROT|nr:VOC family protein [Usitatibacter palustris]QJR13774.1 hypothetical protein DSM104440_00564 [Usitatibacter palustris]